MWSFFRHPKMIELPSWKFRPLEFRPMEGEEVVLQLARGKWLVTDGAYLAHSDEIGHVSMCAGSLRVRYGRDGLDSLTLVYTAKNPIFNRSSEIVIDSGHVVVCCEDAFVGAGITDLRGSGAVMRASSKLLRNADVVLIEDVDESCVGIIARPPLGDGVYRLSYASEGELQSLRIDLAESC